MVCKISALIHEFQFFLVLLHPELGNMIEWIKNPTLFVFSLCYMYCRAICVNSLQCNRKQSLYRWIRRLQIIFINIQHAKYSFIVRYGSKFDIFSEKPMWYWCNLTNLTPEINADPRKSMFIMLFGYIFDFPQKYVNTFL